MNVQRLFPAGPKLPRRATLVALVAAASLLALPSASGQEEEAKKPNPYSAQTIAEMKRLQKAALESGYAFEQVRYLSNSIGPRLTGSAQAQAAVEYVAGELRRLGLEITLEPVMVPRWVRGEEKAELVEYKGQAPGTSQKVVLTALGNSIATPPAGLAADVVVVNDLDEFQALSREQVAGKIVLFNEKFDKRMAAEGHGGPAYGEAVFYRSVGPAAGGAKGAAAVLIRSVGGADYRIPHTGITAWREGRTTVPAGAVSAEDADLIADLASQGRVRMHLTLTPQFLGEVKSYNVIGDLKGSEHPEQVVIVSGHLDSWDLGTGAIDDGAGVAVAMQAAQLVRQLGLHPKRTIRVIAWMDEETGGRGYKQYATEHASGVASHFAAIESDLGAGHPVGIYFTGKKELGDYLEPIGKVLAASGAGLVTPLAFTGTDISPLSEAGVPCFAPMQDSRFYFNYHHSAADTLDKIDPRELQENAAVMAVLAYGLANTELPLPR